MRRVHLDAQSIAKEIARLSPVAAIVRGGPAIVTTAETILTSTPKLPFVDYKNGEVAVLSGELALTPGTGATTIQIRVIMGTTVGGGIGDYPILQYPCTAGVEQYIAFNLVDDAAFEGVQYSMEVSLVGATGNSTWEYAGITAQIANVSFTA